MIYDERCKKHYSNMEIGGEGEGNITVVMISMYRIPGQVGTRQAEGTEREPTWLGRRMGGEKWES